MFGFRHMASGLAITMIENPLELQSTLKIPDNHYKACEAGKIPTEGNAAGNTKNYLDLSGANVSPARLPAGFTARGIVALVFSIIAAIVGMAVITWYGMAPLGAATQAAADREVANAQMTGDHDVVTGATPSKAL
jgi:iron transport multicopper oxidase